MVRQMAVPSNRFTVLDYETSNAQEWNSLSPEAENPKPQQATNIVRRVPQTKTSGTTTVKKSPQTTDTKAKTNTDATRGASAKRRGGIRIPLSNRFLIERDNDGRASWRMRQPATSSFRLPRSYDELDPNLFAKGDDSRSRSERPFAILETIGIQTGTFIKPPARYSDRELLIWGKPIHVSNAKSELVTWIKALALEKKHADHKLDQWAKVCAAPARRKQAEIDLKLEEEADRQTFRQIPDLSTKFQAIGYFYWPEDLPPDIYLGKSFEALDPIRIEWRCYITFDTSRSSFKLMSSSSASIESTIRRLKIVVCEIASRASRPARLQLTQALPEEHEVILCRRPDVASLEDRAGVEPTLIADLQELPIESSLGLERRLSMALLETFSRLRFYRTEMKMVVRFGTFILFQWKRKEGDRYSMNEFISMLEDSRCRGRLHSKLVTNETGLDFIERCHQMVDLFEPTDPMILSLKAVEPEFILQFEFAPGSALGTCLLEINFGRRLKNGRFKLVSSRWLPMNKADSGPRNVSRLNLSTIDLPRTMAWQIDIWAMEKSAKPPATPQMSTFLSQLKLGLDSESATDSMRGIPVVQFQSRVQISSVKLKTILQYRLKRSNYFLEISRYSTAAREQISTGKIVFNGVAVKAKWDVILHNTTWDFHLGSQGSLRIGQAGRWDSSVDSLFPRPNTTFDERGSIESTVGIHDFMAKVDAISGLIAGDGKK